MGHRSGLRECVLPRPDNDAARNVSHESAASVCREFRFLITHSDLPSSRSGACSRGSRASNLASRCSRERSSNDWIQTRCTRANTDPRGGSRDPRRLTHNPRAGRYEPRRWRPMEVNRSSRVSLLKAKIVQKSAYALQNNVATTRLDLINSARAGGHRSHRSLSKG